MRVTDRQTDRQTELRSPIPRGLGDRNSLSVRHNISQHISILLSPTINVPLRARADAFNFVVKLPIPVGSLEYILAFSAPFSSRTLCAKND